MQPLDTMAPPPGTSPAAWWLATGCGPRPSQEELAAYDQQQSDAAWETFKALAAEADFDTVDPFTGALRWARELIEETEREVADLLAAAAVLEEGARHG